MAVMVRDLPLKERPREKLFAHGPKALSNAELLAILLRSGTREKSALRVAEEILARVKGEGIAALLHMSLVELAKVDGVGKVKAATIQAAMELSRRLAMQRAARLELVYEPADVARYAMPHFRFEQKEHFAVLLLNAKNCILGMQEVSVGSLSAAIVHPREVFRAAIDYAAAAIILLHNHPSGDPTPSREDIAVTERLIKAGELMEIPVLDHVVLGDNAFNSMREKGDVKWE